MDTNHDDADPAANGAAKPHFVKPPPPPELAGYVFEKVPPEVAEYFERTFDEQEFWAEVEEVRRTGGVQIDDLIADLRRRFDGRP